MEEILVTLKDEREAGHISMLEDVMDRHYDNISTATFLAFEDLCLISESMCKIAKTIHLIKEDGNGEK